MGMRVRSYNTDCTKVLRKHQGVKAWRQTRTSRTTFYEAFTHKSLSLLARIPRERFYKRIQRLRKLPEAWNYYTARRNKYSGAFIFNWSIYRALNGLQVGCFDFSRRGAGAKRVIAPLLVLLLSGRPASLFNCGSRLLFCFHEFGKASWETLHAAHCPCKGYVTSACYGIRLKSTWPKIRCPYK